MVARYFSLSSKELEMMEAFWQTEKSLAASEIVEDAGLSGWPNGTIHKTLNSLIEKGAVEVDGFKKIGRSYGRTYKASIDADSYALMQFDHYYKNDKRSGAQKTTRLVSAFFERGDQREQDDLIAELEALIQERKDQRK